MALTDYLSLYFNPVAYGTLALAPVVFMLLFYIKAPYGRHIRAGWGPVLDNRLGWFLMESAAVLVFGGIFILWQLHYCHRAFTYPWTLKGGKKMPWLIMLMGLIFNATNGYLNGWSIASQPEKYTQLWLSTPQFLIGVSVFAFGMALNKISDRHLALLSRSRSGDMAYLIPHGFAYRWVSCPNYLGEIIQWIGWAIATWSLAGVVFAVWTMANLVPRALAHHRWYQQTFKDYPSGRRALIPLVF